jgi:putative aldouronate transport system substrate-binding protein
MMKRKSIRSKWASLAMVGIFSVTTLLSGCGVDKQNTPSPTPDSKGTTNDSLAPVELSYYYVAPPQKNQQAIEDALNVITKQKINATVKLNALDFGNYEQKMTVMIASGEKFDLAFTASWFNNYFANAAKGAFLPIDDLMDQYAPLTKAGVPTKIWEAARVNGNIYGVINYQTMAAGQGIMVQKELADKYNFDWKSVTKQSDLEPYLEAVKNGEPDKVPLEFSTAADLFNLNMHGFDGIGDTKSPGVISLVDSDLKVVNQYESEEYKGFITMLHDWYKKGYLRKDAATVKDVSSDRKIAKYAAVMPAGLDFDSTSSYDQFGKLKALTSVEWYDKLITKPIVTTSLASATLTAISKTSANPERAMMFIELLNSDPEVSNLLNYGIEDVNYKKVGENKIEQIKDSGYDPVVPWVFGNNMIVWQNQNETQNMTAVWDELNKTADVSPILGFTFDVEPVKSEIAQTQAVIDQYLAALSSGTADPEKVLPEFVAKLKTAGSEKIIAEKQKQLDAWRQVNGK